MGGWTDVGGRWRCKWKSFIVFVWDAKKRTTLARSESCFIPHMAVPINPCPLSKGFVPKAFK